MPRKATGQKSKLEEKVWRDLVALGLHEGCQRQYRFHTERKWKADFAWPLLHTHNIYEELSIIDLMLEVNGGTYIRGSNRGAHSRGPRQREDYEKWSEASLLGWTLILVDSVDVRKGVHIDRVLRAMGRA